MISSRKGLEGGWGGGGVPSSEKLLGATRHYTFFFLSSKHIRIFTAGLWAFPSPEVPSSSELNRNGPGNESLPIIYTGVTNNRSISISLSFRIGIVVVRTTK